METLTVQQAAELLHMNAKRVQGLARAGKLPAIRVGRRWLFTRESLRQMLGQPVELSPTPRAAFELSARNHLHGVITQLRLEGLMAEVHLRIGEQTLVSVITRSSAERLGLRVGGEAVAVIKSTEVMIGSWEAPS
ncbi:MAG: TOBE domain-containing protein [Candidatus Eisenbacteria bacterium]